MSLAVARSGAPAQSPTQPPRSSHRQFTTEGQTAAMPIPPNTSQRDLVRLALLLCGDRASATSRPATKGP
jgi:hypothetical protein